MLQYYQHEVPAASALVQMPPTEQPSVPMSWLGSSSSTCELPHCALSDVTTDVAKLTCSQKSTKDEVHSLSAGTWCCCRHQTSAQEHGVSWTPATQLNCTVSTRCTAAATTSVRGELDTELHLQTWLSFCFENQQDDTWHSAAQSASASGTY